MLESTKSDKKGRRKNLKASHQENAETQKCKLPRKNSFQSAKFKEENFGAN